MVVHTFNPRLGRQRHLEVCEFKATLGYTRLNQSRRETELTLRGSQHWGSHAFNAFNPDTREVEAGGMWLGRERNIKGKRQELSGVWSLRLVESIAGSPLCLSEPW